jgi:hypothetical protein
LAGGVLPNWYPHGMGKLIQTLSFNEEPGVVLKNEYSSMTSEILSPSELHQGGW